MRKLHPKVAEAAIVIQSWISAGMKHEDLLAKLGAPEGLISKTLKQAQKPSPGGAVVADIRHRVAREEARPSLEAADPSELSATEKHEEPLGHDSDLAEDDID